MAMKMSRKLREARILRYNRIASRIQRRLAEAYRTNNHAAVQQWTLELERLAP